MIQPDRQPTRLALGEIDPIQPIDPTSPLARGLEGLWLPLPHLSGGERLYDLSAYGRHGTLEDTGVAQATWTQDSKSPTPALKGNGGPIATPQESIQHDEFTFWSDIIALSYEYQTPASIQSDRANEIWVRMKLRLGGGVWWEIAENDSSGSTDRNTRIEVSSAYSLNTRFRLYGVKTSSEIILYKNAEEIGRLDASYGAVSSTYPLNLIHEQVGGEDYKGIMVSAGVISRVANVDRIESEIRRGFPSLLNRRDQSALYVSSASGITGTASITDGGETVSATGQTEVSGTLSVTDSSETLTINGATKVSGTASITDAVETVLASGTAEVEGDFALTDSGEVITASGAVITTGTLSITDSGEIISAVSALQDITGTVQITDSGGDVSATGEVKIAGTVTLNDGTEEIIIVGENDITGSLAVTDSGELISMVSTLQDITGTVQITDSGEEIDATGEVKIAGTATLADGSEEIIIVGENDVTGSLSFADLAEEIAANGAVEVQGSLALTDSGETISARARIPKRLATVDVRLEDIIIVNAKLTD